jgi:hypothetical protein
VFGRRLGLGGARLVALGAVVVAAFFVGNASAGSTATKLCVPEKAGKPVVAPTSGATCKNGYRLVELGAEGREGPAGATGKEGPTGPQGPEGKESQETKTAITNLQTTVAKLEAEQPTTPEDFTAFSGTFLESGQERYSPVYASGNYSEIAISGNGGNADLEVSDDQKTWIQEAHINGGTFNGHVTGSYYRVLAQGPGTFTVIGQFSD